MKQRTVIKTVRGQNAVDGAGVRLVRVLGHRDVSDFDPFLMLDSFDSDNPSDYVAGFPMHPHRGIETITYLISGRIEHKDSLGNKDVIRAGECQWMTAGSGIMHEEMPKEAGRMLGFQLWLNLPRENKMTEPGYLSITEAMIPEVKSEQACVRVLSGAYEGATGVMPAYIKASILDVALEAGSSIALPVKEDENAFLFFMDGGASVAGQEITEKTAVLLGEGDHVTVEARPDAPARFIFYAGKPLKEPIAWGGPIVMNTREELETAFGELRAGTFIKR